MPEGLVIAGGVVGLIGGTLSIVSWIIDRTAPGRQRRAEKRAADYNIDDSYL